MDRSREQAGAACQHRWWIGLSCAFVIALAIPAEPSRAETAIESESESMPGVQAGAAPTSRDWEFELQPYLWLAMIDGEVDTDRFGHRHFSADAQDVVKGLDFGAMGSGSVRWKRFLVLVDVAWAEVSERDGIGNDLIRFDVTQQFGWLEVLAGYRLYQQPGGLLARAGGSGSRSFDLDGFAGFTYSWTKLELDLARDTLSQVPAPEREIQSHDDWAAPYLAMRVRNDFTDRLEHETFVGVGGFGVGDAPDISWQVTSGFSYAVLANVRMSAGYRALGAGTENLELTMHGPMLGALLRF